MEEKEKDGDYALNTFKDIWKYDPARLLDLGNDFQVLLSSKKPGVDEEARAISNFEKLTEDRPRPFEHTIVDATRLLPDVVSILTGPVLAVAKKSAIKKAAKETGSKVARELVNENTSDIARAFNNSKLLQGNAKRLAAKGWVRNLYENKEAMNRVAGRNLSKDEIKAVRNGLHDAVARRIDLYNKGVDDLKPVAQRVNMGEKYLPKDLDSLRHYFTDSGLLSSVEWKKFAKNFVELPEYDKRMHFSHINIDRLLEEIPKEKHNIVKDILSDVILEGAKSLETPVPTALATLKAADAGLNKAAKINFQTNKELEMKPNYWTLGSEPTPVSDFIASVFNVDFDDPARFNKKDIDAFFEFLEDIGTIEPGIKDKWTPRQKVSVLRELMSDKGYGSYIKERWANSNHRKNWLKSYDVPQLKVYSGE